MQALALKGVVRARELRTTFSSADGKRAGDLLGRDFTAPAPNPVWVIDFTYVRTWVGFVCVAFVLDVFARRIINVDETTGGRGSPRGRHRSQMSAVASALARRALAGDSRPA